MTQSRNSRRLAGASASSLVAVTAAAVAFVVNILMARLLGPSARGEVAWVLQASYVLAPVVAMGVEREALRGFASRSPASHSHVWVLAVIMSSAGYLVGGWRAAALALLAAGGAALAIERGHAMGGGVFTRYIALQMSVQAWTLAGALTLYVAQVTSVQAWLAIYVIPAPFLFGLWLVSAVRAWRHSSVRRRGSWRAATGATITHVPGTLGAILASRGERLLLPVLASNSALGLYVAVATASESLLWFTQGLSDSRVSGLVSGAATRRRLAKAAIRDAGVFAAVATGLGVLIRWLLVPALGPDFADARHLVFPVCLAAALWATYRQVISTWIASGGAHRTSRLEMLGAVVVIGCSGVAIPVWGALGAAIACIVAYTLMIIVAVSTARTFDPEVASHASP